MNIKAGIVQELKTEADAILKMAARLDEQAVETALSC